MVRYSHGLPAGGEISVSGHHWTYVEWEANTVAKIVEGTVAAPDEHRRDWLIVQVRLAIAQALRHGRSGRADSDPVEP